MLFLSWGAVVLAWGTTSLSARPLHILSPSWTIPPLFCTLNFYSLPITSSRKPSLVPQPPPTGLDIPSLSFHGSLLTDLTCSYPSVL